MITRRHLMTFVGFLALVLLSGSSAYAQPYPGACPPGLGEALNGPKGGVYLALAGGLGPNVANLAALTALANDEASYQNLLNLANAIANASGGRLVITLPDGTVVVDTARNDGPGNPQNNSYPNFVAKTINENHNTRVSVMNAQVWPCGIAVESKLSTSTGRYEHYTAIRLGNHLDNAGTARLSVQQ